MRPYNQTMPVSDFLENNFLHFNARELLQAAKGYKQFVIDNDGKMLVSLAGAMSTAEIGKTLAPLIRSGCVHAISSTGANIEEDLFNLTGNTRYRIEPEWRYLTMDRDQEILERGYNRVTDTCIPEDVMVDMHLALRDCWQRAASRNDRYFHWEYCYQLIRDGYFIGRSCIPMESSWVLAACEMDIPIYTPGAEDSTIGNMFCADVMQGVVSTHNVLKSGTEQFQHLTEWYRANDKNHEIGFFQIGGGIAGDFAMCVVPSIIQDHQQPCKHWRYFTHIGDAVTSYGGYSGCPANEKITWHKLDPDTENHTINSDASIVAPLIFQYVLEQLHVSGAQHSGEKAERGKAHA